MALSGLEVKQSQPLRKRMGIRPPPFVKADLAPLKLGPKRV